MRTHFDTAEDLVHQLDPLILDDQLVSLRAARQDGDARVDGDEGHDDRHPGHKRHTQGLVQHVEGHPDLHVR